MPRPRPLVLHVAPFLWSGAGSVITRLCEAQRRHGPVGLVTAGRAGGQQDWPGFRDRLRRAGVTHDRIDFFHRERDVFLDAVERLAGVIRTRRPRVIHAHAGVPATGAVLARALAGSDARLIAQMYSWGPNRPAWMDRQDAWGFAESDRVVCSARAYWDRLVRAGVPARRLVYLPWGLPLETLPVRSALPDAAGPVLGFVGRIEPRKGQLALVEAYARLRRSLPSARLELVGPIADPAYGRAIRRAVAAHRLGRTVELTGEVRDVTTFVRRWDLFVSLSADEGQGLAVLEAMALGVPVLARPVAGIADFLVDGRTGLVVPSAAPRTVAARIARAWSDRDARAAVARRARRMVERRYAWDGTVAAFDRLYWDSRRATVRAARP